MSTLLLPLRPDAAVQPGSFGGRQVVTMALLAIGITVLHLLLVLTCTGQDTWAKAYKSLSWWDSGWFEWIASKGYSSPLKLTVENFGNVAFLPGYPISAHLVHRLTGLDWPYPLLIAAQIASVGFWFYLLLLLRQGNVPVAWMALAVVILLFQPAAFFLVAGYSEPLFMMSMLGFLFWSQRRSRLAFVLACLHGMVMCATRIVGVVVVVYPLVHAWCNDETIREEVRRLRPTWSLLRWAVIGGIASLGLILFFVYCWWRFGAWNLYFQTLKLNWNVVSNYFAFFNRRTWLMAPRFLPGTPYFDPNNLSRIMVPLTIAIFGVLGWMEWKKAKQGDEGWRQRLGYYLVAALMFYINVAGRDSLFQNGMIRYVHGVEVLLLLAALPLLHNSGSLQRIPRWAKISALGAILYISLVGQILYVYLFAHLEWVA